jgi:hypothetical protein
MPTDNLETVIEDSITDSELPLETTDTVVDESTPDETVEASPEADKAAAEAAVAEVVDGEAKPDAKLESGEKKPANNPFGINQYTASGRENRIPYSRVKKITEKAVADAKKEWETGTTPKLTEYETKIKGYEERLERIGRFEDVMINKPEKFLDMLATLPAYKQFFTAIEDAFNKANGQPQAQAQPNQPVADDMPQPDQRLADGTMVYSMKGLSDLNAWNRAQARKETLAEVEKVYGPIQKEWQAQRRVQEVIPQVQQQIADARTWPQFNENEQEIVKVLQDNPRISLEGAYRQVVFPRLVADRNKMKEELMKELKTAPKATSVATVQSKSGPASAGPRSLEDIIAEEIKKIK